MLFPPSRRHRAFSFSQLRTVYNSWNSRVCRPPLRYNNPIWSNLGSRSANTILWISISLNERFSLTPKTSKMHIHRTFFKMTVKCTRNRSSGVVRVRYPCPVPLLLIGDGGWQRGSTDGVTDRTRRRSWVQGIRPL